MKTILKFIPIELILEYLVDYIIGTVKNPNSKEAKRIFTVLVKVDDAIQLYFKKVPPPSA